MGPIVSQIGLPDSILLGGGRSVVILIERPKTRRYLGRRQFALIDDWATVSWLYWFLEGIARDDKFFPGSGAELRAILKEGLRFMGLEHLQLVLAGLRTGGATYFFRRDQNLGKLQFMGRWRAVATLHYYLQEGMTAHLLAGLSDDTEQFLLSLRPRLESLRSPPRVSAVQLIPWRRVHDGSKQR